MTGRGQIVIVSGAPGAGKTTLAIPLAQELGFALFSKDLVKETITDALGAGGGDLPASRRLGGAAMELLWMLAQHAPQAVLEANFRPHSDYERARLAAFNADIVEVYCECGSDEAARRFRDRAAVAGRHAAHPLREMSPAMLAEYDRPVGIGPVVQVDTRVSVNAELVARQVMHCFSESRCERALQSW
jgi:predicted kinase